MQNVHMTWIDFNTVEESERAHSLEFLVQVHLHLILHLGVYHVTGTHAYITRKGVFRSVLLLVFAWKCTKTIYIFVFF